METPNSTSDITLTASRRRRFRRPGGLRRHVLVLTAAAGALAVTLPAATPSIAAPVGLSAAAAADPAGSAKVAKLTKEIKALEKEYGGNLEQLRDARKDAAEALERAKDLKADLTRARALVAQMAASQYMNSGVDPSVQMLASDDPTDMLNGATLAVHVTQHHAAKVQQIQSLVGQQEKARKEAALKIKKLEADIKEIAAQRERVRALLKKYKPESPMVGRGGMTARMIKVRDEIEEEYGPFLVIGCTRPGDPLDHGSGRACDFMESSGGRMPTSERLAHGDAVSAFAIRNAERLGIKYIIWKQRIYDLRGSGSWKMMSDRGSITQNHFDHVHISVF